MEQAELELQEHREVQQGRMMKEILRLSLHALAERGLRYVALLATIFMFAWAMFEPAGLRTINAGLFALVFVIVLHKKGGGDA
jgi:hypothetical protein